MHHIFVCKQAPDVIEGQPSREHGMCLMSRTSLIRLMLATWSWGGEGCRWIDYRQHGAEEGCFDDMKIYRSFQ
jgi:hypothetical protein